MYNRLKLVQKFFWYCYKASNGNGHGIHSPFVYDFVTNVLKDKSQLEKSKEIEQLRNDLLHNKNLIAVEDFGAGSGTIKTTQRVIKEIASSSLKPRKYALLLARITKYYRSQTIIELGTSFGISTAYFAVVNPEATVYTLEGCPGISHIAQHNFNQLGLQNIHLLMGNFDNTLPALLPQLPKVDLAFVDGNHRKIPVLNYFHWLLAKATPQSVFIFDDIHWSREMEEAWEQLKKHPAVTLTIDLFFIGLVFFNKDFKVPQHFVIRF